MTNKKECCDYGEEEEDFLVELVVQGQKLRPVPERSLVENSGFFRNVFNKMQQQEEEGAPSDDDYIVLTLNEDGRGQQHQCTTSGDPLSKISFETMNAIVEYFDPLQGSSNFHLSFSEWGYNKAAFEDKLY